MKFLPALFLACYNCVQSSSYSVTLTSQAHINIVSFFVFPSALFLHFIFPQALFFAAVDLDNELGGHVAGTSLALAKQIARRCFLAGPFALVDQAGQGQDTEFGLFVRLLSEELLSPCESVRALVKELLLEFGTASSTPVATLLARSNLREIIFPKTARNSPINIQTGRMDALTFCLTIEPPLTEFLPTNVEGAPTNSNTSYFSEIQQICRLDDVQSQNTRTAAVLAPSTVVSFRQQALELMSVIMRNSAWKDHYKHAVDLFIRGFASRHEEIVAVSVRGLRQLNIVSKVPEEDLRAWLRPALDNLSDAHKLSVPVLRSLGILVELLPSMFHAKLAEALFDHLSKRAAGLADELAATSPAASADGKDAETVQICRSIIDVFAKLQQLGMPYVPQIIEKVLSMEIHLARVASSPLRASLTAYLAIYPTQTLDCLLERHASAPHARLLMTLLKGPQAQVFAKPLLDSPDILVDRLLAPAMAAAAEAQADRQQRLAASRPLHLGLCVVRAVSKLRPGFVAEHARLAATLKALWVAPWFHERLQPDDATVLSAAAVRLTEPVLLAKILCDYLRIKSEDLEVLVKLLDVFAQHSLLSFFFLKRFLYFELFEACAPALRRQILFYVLEHMHDRGLSQSTVTCLVEKVLTPLLATSLAAGGDLEALLGGAGDSGFVHTLVAKALLHPAAEFSDSLKMALLQLLALLLNASRKHPPIKAAMLAVKQELLLDFAWTFCFPVSEIADASASGNSNGTASAAAAAGTSSSSNAGSSTTSTSSSGGSKLWSLDDIVVKYTGFVVISMLMELYEHSPSHMLLPLHDALLEASVQEHRPIITQAIDALEPMLPRSSSSSSTSDGGKTNATGTSSAAAASKPPQWAVKIRELLAGESHAQTQHAWVVISRHPDIFYPHRSMLVPAVVQSLTRLNSASQADNRRLAMDMAEVLVRWEQRAASEQQPPQQPPSQPQTQAPAPAQPQQPQQPQQGEASASGAAAMEGVVSASGTAANSSGDTTAPGTAAAATPAAPAGVTSSAALSAATTATAPATATSTTAPGTTSAPPAATAPGRMSLRSQEMMLNFLMVSAWQLNDNPSNVALTHGLGQRCLMLFDAVLKPEMWLQANFNLSRWDQLIPQALSDTSNPANSTLFNVQVTLRIFLMILQRLPREQALSKAVQIKLALVSLLTCKQPQVAAQYVESLVTLLRLYPLVAATEKRSTPAVPELDTLYRTLLQNCSAALDAYDKTGQLGTLPLALRVLQVMHRSQPTVLRDMHLGLLKVVQRIHRDITPAIGVPAQPLTDDLRAVLILSMELSASQIHHADANNRKVFVALLQALSDKPQSPLVLQAIVNILGEWSLKGSDVIANKEKANMLYRALSTFHKRFGKDPLLTTCMGVVLQIFQNQELANSDFTQRLEAGFMMGLRSRDAAQRAVFFDIYNKPVQSASLYERLDYCFSDRCQRWDSSKYNFWVKHCLDIILMGVNRSIPVSIQTGLPVFPSAARLLRQLPPSAPVTRQQTPQPQQQEQQQQQQQQQQESDSMQGVQRPQPQQQQQHQQQSAAGAGAGAGGAAGASLANCFQSRLLAEVYVDSLVASLRTLCHANIDLAYEVWIDLFPLLWQVLTDQERVSVGQCLQTLLQQDYHHDQAMLRPNNVHAIVTGISRCSQPMLALPTALLLYLSKTHNLWYTGISMLRHQQTRAVKQEKVIDGKYDPIEEALGDLYLQLGEEDTWYGQWRLRNNKLPVTGKALLLEQQVERIRKEMHQGL